MTYHTAGSAELAQQPLTGSSTRLCHHILSFNETLNSRHLEEITSVDQRYERLDRVAVVPASLLHLRLQDVSSGIHLRTCLFGPAHLSALNSDWFLKEVLRGIRTDRWNYSIPKAWQRNSLTLLEAMMPALRRPIVKSQGPMFHCSMETN